MPTVTEDIFMTTTLLLSALGGETFSHEQRQLISRDASTVFHAQPEPMSEDAFIDLARPHQIVALTRRPMKYLRRPVLEQLPNLRALVVHTTGTHWIDTEFLKERRVALLSISDYATTTVVEQTLACLLTLSRRTHLSHDRARGLLPEHVSLRGFELKGKTVGLIGYGRIGQALAPVLSGLGLNVIVHDPEASISVPLNDLLRSIDIIVMAASQDYDRPPIIGKAELEATSATHLVNASCDELVDHHAVVDAILAGKLGGYALDEYDEVLTDPRLEPGRVLQTMHTGWYADEAMDRGRAQWVERIVCAQDIVSDRSSGRHPRRNAA